MKNILNKLNMTIKEFSEHYKIPYNTVRQWVNGTRQPPSYVTKLLNEKIEREKKDTHIEITEINSCYKCKEYENITGYSGNCNLEGIVYSSGKCKNFKKRR